VASESRGLETGVLALERDFVLPQRPSILTTVLRFIVRKPLGTFGFLLIFLVGFTAVAEPLIARYDGLKTFEMINPAYDPNSFDPAALSPTKVNTQGPPSMTNWFGTDHQGHDTYARIIRGARRSLGVGLGALAIGTTAGVLIALVSAYIKGTFDLILQRFMDGFQAFPPLVFLVLLVTVTEPSLMSLTIGLGVVATPQVSRVVRSAVFQAREMPYVEAARVIGCPPTRIMLRHILPNVMAPVIVVFSIGVGTAILAEAMLTFLGLGPPGISWGQMLNTGRLFLLDSPWQAVFSGLAITLAVLGFNLAGDALRDVLDPRLGLRAT
jgi:peptide/nickel transport system permease protein